MKSNVLEIEQKKEGKHKYLTLNRTIPAQHIPKKAMDFDTVISVDPSKKDNTFDRTIGENKYREFSTTNATYGDFSQPENKYKVLGMSERMYNDFFKCYVGKAKITSTVTPIKKDKAEEDKNNILKKLEQARNSLFEKIVNVCISKGWLGLRQFKNYLKNLSKKHNNLIHKDDVKYFFVNYGICLEERELEFICLSFQSSRNDIDYVSLLDSFIICDEKRYEMIKRFIRELHGINETITKALLDKLLNPEIHPSVMKYQITDKELAKEYSEVLEGKTSFTDEELAQLFAEISTCIPEDGDFTQALKACGFQE